jgi:hypothetical protein
MDYTYEPEHEVIEEGEEPWIMPGSYTIHRDPDQDGFRDMPWIVYDYEVGPLADLLVSFLSPPVSQPNDTAILLLRRLLRCGTIREEAGEAVFRFQVPGTYLSDDEMNLIRDLNG